jgi:hypothetical protein
VGTTEYVFIGIIVYMAVGVGLMLWMRHDNEFRMMESIDIFSYGSIILWPVLVPLYIFLRPPEQLEDLAAKKSHQDFKNFMRQRKHLDTDLLAKLDKQTSPDQPYEISGATEEFRDHHLEDLIHGCEWQEAMRTANDMLRFAREQQEYSRIEAYERYIKEIKDKRLEEMS